MTSWKRLLFYLTLNIIVSAVTTLLVLNWWDSTHRINSPAPSGSLTAQNAAPAAGTAKAPGGAAATPIPASQPVLEIKNVFGVGDLQNEVVILKRVGDGEISMAGWKLQDENGHAFSFPDLALNKDGAVQIYTRAGVNTVVELYWGLKDPAWKSGELVTILDPQGNVRAKYTIP